MSSFANRCLDSASNAAQRVSIRMLRRLSVHPSFWSPSRNAAMWACDRESFSAKPISTPMRFKLGSLRDTTRLFWAKSGPFSRYLEIGLSRGSEASLDHIGGRNKQSIGQHKPERLCRLFIKEEFNLCGFFDREISGFGSLQNLVYENSRTTTHRGLVSSVGH